MTETSTDKCWLWKSPGTDVQFSFKFSGLLDKSFQFGWTKIIVCLGPKNGVLELVLTQFNNFSELYKHLTCVIYNQRSLKYPISWFWLIHFIVRKGVLTVSSTFLLTSPFNSCLSVGIPIWASSISLILPAYKQTNVHKPHTLLKVPCRQHTLIYLKYMYII